MIDNLKKLLENNSKPWTEYIGQMKIYTPEVISELMVGAGFAQTEIRRTKSKRVCVIGRK